MSYPNKEPKEIRLFGEKSIREEAYRQKILQLEKELVHLEALAKEANSVNTQSVDMQQEKKSPEKLDGLYYESLISFDRRVKKEQEFFEKRAGEVTERLETQARQLILSLESSFRKKTKWLIFSISMTAILIAILLAAFFNSNGQSLAEKLNIRIPQYSLSLTKKGQPASRIPYLKTALQTQTKYHHQYELTYLQQLNHEYIVHLELNTPPTNRWHLKNLCAEVSETFQNYAGGQPAELSFFYRGKLYAKTTLEESSNKPHLQYFY